MAGKMLLGMLAHRCVEEYGSGRRGAAEAGAKISRTTARLHRK
jgi:hypothetical protein